GGAVGDHGRRLRALRRGDGRPGPGRGGPRAQADRRAPGVRQVGAAVRRRRPQATAGAGRSPGSRRRRPVRRHHEGDLRMNTMKWWLKRELQEHRGGFFWAPIIVGIVFLLLSVGGIVATLAAAGRAHIQVGLIKFDTVLRNLDPDALRMAGAGVDMTLYMVAGIIGIVVGFVVFFYCLGALYDERRDRSVLFWKSLPLSDAATVTSKVLSATVVAPLIGTVAGILTGVGVLLIIAIFFAFYGQNVLGLLFSGNPL